MSILTDTFQAIADAIRAKTGKVDTMTPAEMPTGILSINTGSKNTSIREGITNRINLSITVYEEE